MHFPNTNGTSLDAIANNMLTLWWQMHFWTRASTLIEENPVLHKLKRKMTQITCWKPFWPKDGSRVNFNFVSTPKNKKEKNGHYFHLAQREKNPTTEIRTQDFSYMFQQLHFNLFLWILVFTVDSRHMLRSTWTKCF